MRLFHVVKPGLLTTLQDLGRYGFQKYGVPVCGAMDKYSFISANLLVGNHANDACLEITLLGPELKVLNRAQIAVTGADFSISINDEPMPMWQTIEVEKEDVITFAGTPRSGCRAYLAATGGFNVPLVLGSRSTYTRGGFGGYEGRALKPEDLLKAFMSERFPKTKRVMPSALIPKYENPFTVNVIPGPQEDLFTAVGVETFLSSTYTITPESDRMGYRLDGPQIERKDLGEIVTEALVQGAVQVPGNGEPIVLMADAQASGGYPKIATVTTPGVSCLAQAKPNDRVRFNRISLSQAHAEFVEFSAVLFWGREN
jgi:antagonist of KipI